MTRRTFVCAATAASLPRDWQWDRSIKNFASLKQSVLRFAERHAKANPKANNIGALTLLGEIQSLRKTASVAFLDEQSPSGWLTGIDSLVLRGEGYRPIQEILIKHRERVGLCVALKRIPKYRFRFLDPLMGPKAMNLWLETQDWSNPWAVGNVDMDSAYALAFEWKVMGNEKAGAALVSWLEWHNRHIDPRMGFWDFARTGDVLRSMAGGMHQLCIYFLFGREAPWHERAIAATLSLQQANGLFSPDTYGHHGLDMDAVYVLANLHNRYGDSRAAVRSALERTFEANLKCFHPDGGAVSRVGIDRQPDAWSTWCRVSIAGRCARLLGIPEFQGPWGFGSLHPFHPEKGGAGLPDWLDDKWYEATDWPRPVRSGRS